MMQQPQRFPVVSTHIRYTDRKWIVVDNTANENIIMAKNLVNLGQVMVP